jgi:hypothetical protein
MVRQADEGTARFHRYLAAIVEQAFRTGDSTDERGAEADHEGMSTKPVGQHELDAACAIGCALCRGDCCLNGEARMAYLDVETVQHFRSRHRDASFDDVMQAYLSRLPRRVTEGGCYFQGSRGCTLPREMRSNVCNRYFCEEMRRFRSETAAARSNGQSAEPVRAFFVVTLPNGRRQTAFFDSSTP